MGSQEMQVLAVWSGLIAAMAVLAYGMMKFTAWEPTPAPAAPAPAAPAPLVWTEAGLIDFFQLNDHMTAEQLAKFRAILATVEPAPAAVEPAPAAPAKPHIKLSVESVRLATVEPAPAAVEPAPAAVEPIQEIRNLAAQLLDSPAPAARKSRRVRRAFRLSAENTAGLVSIALILVIALSNTMAGLALRATLAVPAYWLGWIEQDTLNAFCLNYALKLI